MCESPNAWGVEVTSRRRFHWGFLLRHPSEVWPTLLQWEKSSTESENPVPALGAGHAASSGDFGWARQRGGAERCSGVRRSQCWLLAITDPDVKMLFPNRKEMRWGSWWGEHNLRHQLCTWDMEKGRKYKDSCFSKMSFWSYWFLKILP